MPLPQTRRVVAAALVLAVPAFTQRFAASRKGLPDKSDRVVSYTMGVKLDPVARVVTGTQRIRYRNRTQGATRELRFHLYLNAFRNLRSTHLRGNANAKKYKDESEFGEIRFTELRLASGAGGPKELLSGLAYVSPDDGNPHDRTVAKVDLPAALEPGQEIELQTSFEARLPKAYRRTGWGPGNFFMVAQWFPKLGVLEHRGGAVSDWNCHQFHASTEFYADFGTYDVSITVPTGWPVGATGKLTGDVQSDGKADTHRFVQQDVHDFAWVTDPDYVVETFTFQGAGQLEPKMKQILGAQGWSDGELALTDVDVTMLLHPEHASEEQIARHRRAVETAIRFYGSRFGRYPYSTLTVVDPCTDVGWGRLAGGMEYPTLITCGTTLYPSSRRLRPEGVTVHEFGHQYWYGLSANNEFEESWLDEGICSYTEGRAQDLAYAKLGEGDLVGDPLVMTTFQPFDVAGKPFAKLPARKGIWNSLTGMHALPLSDVIAPALAKLGVSDGWRSYAEDDLGFHGTLLPDLPLVRYLRSLPFLTYDGDLPHRNLYGDRAIYLQAPDKDPVVKPAWTYLDRQSYRVNSYQRPATILCTLERMMGPDKWWPCMRRFHERARFTHPTTNDFIATVREYGGEVVANFAREALFTTKTLDYGVASVKTVKTPKRFGRFDDQDPKEEPAETVVTVRRFGELVAPVDVMFEFRGSEPVVATWAVDGQKASREWRFSSAEIAKRGELFRVRVDPPDKRREVGKGPAGVYVLDRNLLNNSWRSYPNKKPARRYSLRLMLWFQTVLSFFGGLG